MRDRGLPLFLFGMIFSLFTNDVWLVGILLSCLWVYTYELKTIGVLWLFFICILLPNNTSYKDVMGGKVIDVKSNSIVMENEGVRVLVSNCDLCGYDDEIKVEGSLKRIESAKSTYGFNFEDWANQERIDYSLYATGVEIIKKGKTLRAQVYQNIKKIDHTKTQQFLLKMIFNLHQNDDEFPLLTQLGFGYYGFILLFRKLSSYVMHRKQSEKIEWIVIIAGLIFYQAPFIIVRITLGKLIRYTPLSSMDKVGAYGLLCWLFFPWKMMSLSFLVPFGFRLIHQLYFKDKRIVRYAFIMIIQSFFFNQINGFMILFYSVILKCMGFFYICAWIYFLIPIQLFQTIFFLFLTGISGLSSWIIYGNFIGWGLPFFILLQLFQKEKKSLHFILSFILFLKGGLFHPLTEVVFLQIGQGDSILIHSIFLNQNILIDTGKKSQYNLLESALKARGITELDAVFITHFDEDHSGGLELLKSEFYVRNVIDIHRDYQSRGINLTSLNKKNEGDQNDNSLVHLISINGTRLLLTGDISSGIEKDIVRNYPDLEIEVLKVGHHGSKTSTSQKLLEVTNPHLAIISSGLNNSFNHPHPEVIERLEKMHISALNTQEEGDISIYFTPFFNFIVTTSKKIGIINRVIK